LTDTVGIKRDEVAEMLLEYLCGDVLDLDRLIRRDGDDRIAMGIVSRVGK